MATSLLSDGFDYVSLCTALNAAPVALGPVSKSDLFRDEPCQSTEVAIELIDSKLTLVQSSLRGGPTRPHPITGRSMVKLPVPHLKVSSTMLADSWVNRTGYGTATPASVHTERARILAEHRSNLEATIDYHKTKALQGQILDADGALMVDLHAEFGIIQHVVDFALDVSTTSVVNKITAARRLSETELGSAFASGWICFASPEFMDAIRDHASVKDALAGWTGASTMLADVRSGELVIGGAKFVEVGPRASKVYINSGDAFLCPQGTVDLFKCALAPADYIEAIGSEGLPLYSKAQELALGKGLVIESQANPLPFVTRPKTVIRLTA